jgi:hypothetical protein
MNAFTDEKPVSETLECDLSMDWTVDIDRISRLAREAFRTETPDPWTRIEAECVIQLIDAELLAMSTRQSRGEPAEASIRHLKALRTEAVLAIKTLDAVERHSARENAAPISGRTTIMGQTLNWIDGAPEDEPARDQPPGIGTRWQPSTAPSALLEESAADERTQ